MKGDEPRPLQACGSPCGHRLSPPEWTRLGKRRLPLRRSGSRESSKLQISNQASLVARSHEACSNGKRRDRGSESLHLRSKGCCRVLLIQNKKRNVEEQNKQHHRACDGSIQGYRRSLRSKESTQHVDAVRPYREQRRGGGELILIPSAKLRSG